MSPTIGQGFLTYGPASSLGAEDYMRGVYPFSGDGWAVACWGVLQVTGGGGQLVVDAAARTMGTPTAAEVRYYPPGTLPDPWNAGDTWATAGSVVTSLPFGAADAYGNRRTVLRHLVYDDAVIGDGQAVAAMLIRGTDLTPPTGGPYSGGGVLLGAHLGIGLMPAGQLLPTAYFSEEDVPPNTSAALQQRRTTTTLNDPAEDAQGPLGSGFAQVLPDGVSSPRCYIDLLDYDALVLDLRAVSVAIPKAVVPDLPDPPTVQVLYYDRDGAEWPLGDGTLTSDGDDADYWHFGYDVFDGEVGGQALYLGPGRFGYAVRLTSAHPLLRGAGAVDLAVNAVARSVTSLSAVPTPPGGGGEEEPPDEEEPQTTEQPGDVLTVTYPTDPDSYYTPQDDPDGVTWDTPLPCPPTRARPVAAGRAPQVLPQLGRAAGYRVQILTRGGRRAVYDIPDTALTGIAWERRVNDTAEHTIELAKRGPVAGSVLAAVGDPWAYEAAIWRVPQQGVPQLAAVGPIVDWTETRGSLTLAARDVTAWFGKRVIHHDYAFTGCTDLAEIARWLIADAIAPDDPGLLDQALFFPTGISVTRSGVGNTLMLDAELGDLAGLGLDYTVVGRRLVVSGDLAGQWPHVARLGEQHFDGDLEVNVAGGETLTRVWKVGAGAGTGTATGAQVLGYAGGVDGVLGLLETVESDDALVTNDDARTAARVTLAAGYPTPHYVRVPDDSGLHPQAPVTLDLLVPGVGIHVAVEGFYRPVRQTQRLTRVQGTWDRDAGERIAVSLAPWAGLISDDAIVLASPVDTGTFDANVETDPVDALAEATPEATAEEAATTLPPAGDTDPADSGDDEDVTGTEGGADDGTTPDTDEVPPPLGGDTAFGTPPADDTTTTDPTGEG